MLAERYGYRVLGKEKPKKGFICMSKIEKQVSGKEAFGVTIGSLKEAQALVEKQKARIEELEAALEKERAVVDWYADRDSFKSDELNWIGKRARQRIKERR